MLGLVLLALFGLQIAIIIFEILDNVTLSSYSKADGWSHLRQFLTFAAMMLVLVFWTRNTLHEREFRADVDAFGREPELTADWLERAAIYEAGEDDRFWWAEMGGLLDWVYHPRFHTRYRVITEGRPSHWWYDVKEGSRALPLLYTAGFLAFAVFEIGAQFGDEPAPRFLILLYTGALLLLAISGPCALSIGLASVMDRRGLIAGLIYCLSFSLVTIIVVAVLERLAPVLGVYEAAGMVLPADTSMGRFLH